MKADEYLKLQERAKRYQRNADEAAGQLQQLLKRLKEEFGCDDVEQAKALLNELNESIPVLERKVKKGTEKFEKRYGSKLES